MTLRKLYVPCGFFDQHCQCINCQKFIGTGHASNMLLPKAAFSITGEVTAYEHPAVLYFPTP